MTRKSGRRERGSKVEPTRSAPPGSRGGATTAPPAGGASTAAAEGPAWIGGVALVVLVSIAIAVLAAEGRSMKSPGLRSPVEPRAAELHHFSTPWQLPDDGTLGFVEIPAGPFRMGSDPALDPMAFENERWSATGAGQVELEVEAFLIARHPVTTGQYAAFASATGTPAGAEVLAKPADHPVTGISWAEAIAYARWLTAELAHSETTPPAIRALLEQGWTVTLPSEVQWEKAARGTDGRLFPWGDEFRPDRANLAGRNTRPVGSVACPECAYGLSDLSGNVWEFTRTPYREHAGSFAEPLDLGAPALWVMRGGSYQDGPQLGRAAVRGGVDPGVRNPTIGFRLAITPP